MGTVRNSVKTVAKAQREAAKAAAPVKDKVLKYLPVGFKEEAEAMTAYQLEMVIIEAEEILSSNKVDEGEDGELEAAKAKVAVLKEPYKDIEKAQKAKIAYCLKLREDQGKEVTT